MFILFLGSLGFIVFFGKFVVCYQFGEVEDDDEFFVFVVDVGCIIGLLLVVDFGDWFDCFFVDVGDFEYVVGDEVDVDQVIFYGNVEDDDVCSFGCGDVGQVQFGVEVDDWIVVVVYVDYVEQEVWCMWQLGDWVYVEDFVDVVD